MSRAIIVCTSCRYTVEEKVDGEGITGGERLAEHLEKALELSLIHI